jgi:hypothetical protein
MTPPKRSFALRCFVYTSPCLASMQPDPSAAGAIADGFPTSIDASWESTLYEKQQRKIIGIGVCTMSRSISGSDSSANGHIQAYEYLQKGAMSASR